MFCKPLICSHLGSATKVGSVGDCHSVCKEFSPVRVLYAPTTAVQVRVRHVPPSSWYQPTQTVNAGRNRQPVKIGLRVKLVIDGRNTVAQIELSRGWTSNLPFS